MLTIKEIAEICGVSEQSIRKWCAKHEVSQVAKQWRPSEADVEAMFEHYGVEVSQVAKPTKPTKPARNLHRNLEMRQNRCRGRSTKTFVGSSK